MSKSLGLIKNKVCVAQFSKYPRLGQVKTRLLTDFSADTCLSLHKCLTQYCLGVFSHGEWDCQLWASEQANDHFFQALASDYAVGINEQCGDDLGQRMGHCVQQQLQDYGLVVLVGSDCPVLSVDHLRTVVAHWREGNRAVIIPAEDGGYVLLALSRYDLSLFTDIDWGSGKVLRQTEAALAHLQWPFKVLEPLWDVDRAEDLGRLNSLKFGRELLRDVDFTASELRQLESIDG